MPEIPNQLIHPELQPHVDGSNANGVGVPHHPQQSQYAQPPISQPLQSITPYPQWGAPSPDYSVPPLEYSTTPSKFYGMQSETFSNQRIFPSRPRITVLRVIRSILYFIATFIAAFGLIGVFNALYGTGNRAEGLAIFFALGLLVAGVVIFLNMRHRVPQLRLAHFIWGILGATVGWFMALFLAFALGANPNLSFGFIFLLYGLVLAATSLW